MTLGNIHLWQSRVEIKYYSVAYFYCITAFETLYHRTFVNPLGPIEDLSVQLT